VTNRLRLSVPRDGEAPSDSGHHPLRILVADGHAAAADSLVLLLTVLGHEVEVARSGPAALDAARTFRPDMLMTDIVLPKLDGLDLASRLTGDVSCRGTVLVALTGLDDRASRERVRGAGYHHHLVKPVAPDALQELLDSIRPARPMPSAAGANNLLAAAG
jgi:CheY-like chemotaxis protein